jgi:biopolymer transport protein ExbD
VCVLEIAIIVTNVSLQVEDCTTVILPEPVPPCPSETWVTNDAVPDLTTDGTEIPSSPRIETSVPPIATLSHPKRDLSHIIKRLSHQRGLNGAAETVGRVSASKFYETVSEQVAAQRDARKEHVIHLEATENSKFGVFQTVLQSSSAVQMDNVDLMKTQVRKLTF